MILPIFLIISLLATPFTFCFVPPFDFWVEEEPEQVNLQLGPMNLRVKHYQKQSEDPTEKFFANVAACAVGAMCGYVIKAMWEDAGPGYYFSKGFATVALLSAPAKVARELGADPTLAEISMIAAAVLAKVHNR